jgi:HK97 family phage major capsid protein
MPAPTVTTTENSRRYRDRRGQIVTDQRSILAASLTPDLSAEDESRFQALTAEDERLAKAIEREEGLASRDANLSTPIAEPTRPEPRSDATAGDGTRVKPRSTDEYRKAFKRFLMTGDQRSLQTVESRATADGLQADSDAAGGFTYPDEQFVNTLIKFVDNAVIVRQKATVQRVTNADALGAPSLDADPEDGDWTQELTSVDLDTQMEFGKRELRPHELTKGIKVSRKLLARSVMDIDTLVAQRLSYKLAVTQETAFMTGNGVNKPLGLFVASNDGISTARDTTASATTSWTADNLIDVQYSVKPQYQATGEWVLHRDGVRNTRKLKDGNGQYIWQPGLGAGQTDTLLGRPLNQSEYAPNTFTTGLYAALFGDLSFYWIADAEDISIQRLMELYALTNQVGFIARSATDGMPVLAEAFARLKLA